MNTKMLTNPHRRSGAVVTCAGRMDSGDAAIGSGKRFPRVLWTPGRLAAPLCTSLVLAAALPTYGAAKGWNSLVDGFWDVDTNWTPPGVPGASDDVTLGSVAGSEGTRTTLDVTANIRSLNMINGNDLSTADFECVVNGAAGLSGSGTTLLAKENNGGVADSFDADELTIGSGSLVKMLGGRIEVDGSTGSGLFAINGTLTGYGAIDLEDSVTGDESRFTLTSPGIINVGNTSDGGIILVSDVARTLTVSATDADTKADLDQGSSPVINLLPSGTFDLNIPIVPDFDGVYNGTLNLSRKSTLDIEDPWTTAGTINVNTQAGSFVGQTAGPATIDGGVMTMSGGSINLDNAADHLIFEADLEASGGTINHDAGTIEFNGGGRILSTANHIIGGAVELILNSYFEVYDTDWNWDGDGGTNNVITINDSGTLVAYCSDPAADDSWDGLMHINGGSIWAQFSNNDWYANGTIMVGGTTQSDISGDRMLKSSGTLTVATGADLLIDTTSGAAGVSGKLFSGGTVAVNGTLNLASGDFTEWAGSTVTGSGTIQPGTNTVSANQTIGVSTYDWDTGSTTINSGVTLTLNVDTIEQGVTDGFDGSLNIDSGAVTVNTTNPWRMEGTTNLDNTGGGDPTIAGSRMIVGDTNGATVNVTGGLSVIDAPLTLETNGTIDIATGAILNVNGDTIYDGGTITGAGIYNPPAGFSNTVTSDSTIEVDNFNFDRGHWTIESGATLTVSVVDYDSDSPTNVFDFWTVLNSGSVSVSSGDPQFVHDGNLELQNTTGTVPTWSGEPLYFGGDSGTLDANLNVGGTGVSSISSGITFFSDADVFIDGGATLRTGAATFESVNGVENAEFTGTGTWQMTGTNTVNEATTINMVGGTVDLDNSALTFTFFANDTHVNDDFTINVATMSSYGRYSPGSPPIISPSNTDLNIANTATLTVNLDDPNGEWTVNSNGIVNYSGDPTPDWFLAGSDLNMAGTLNVTGAGYVDTRMDISGTVNSLTAGGTFRMSGGNLTDDPNWILGGTINGPGRVGAASLSALYGFGMINADVDFDVTSHLLADNGTLVVNGNILDAYYVGTADGDGILNVPSAWNSSPVTTVFLQGGELTGGDLTLENINGLQGHGVVSARVINNTQIVANGGTLRLTNVSSNWDGSDSPEDGLLHARTGDLEMAGINNGGLFTYDSNIRVDAGQEVFANGMGLYMTNTSILVLNSGILRSTGQARFEGAINANTGTSILRFAGLATFATATTTLNGNLRLANSHTTVQTGATFTGGGVLINDGGASLTLPDGYSLGVQLDNEGDLVLGASPGQVSGTVFTQSATGTLHIEIAGTNPSQIDSLALSSSAQLGGTLALTLDSFTPALGQTFTILTALSRTGEFVTVNQPPTMPAGLEFDVIYNPTNVQLEVVSSSTSFSDWIDTFPSLTDPADKTKTANPDDDEMNNFTEFALDDDPTTGVVSGKIIGKIAPVAGVDVYTLTFPVRTGATPAAGDPPGGELVLEQTTDGVVYRVQASDDLLAGPLDVTEVTGADALAIQAGLPALTSAAWEYRSFRSPGPVAGDDREFMRVEITE